MFPDLASSNLFLRLRALSVYNSFSPVYLRSKEHAQKAAEAFYHGMCENNLVLRVFSARALQNNLENEDVHQYLLGALEKVVLQYLSLLEEIHLEELIKALETIVHDFYEHIAPFAVGLCEKLALAYKNIVADEGAAEVSQEELTAAGCMSTIKRVVSSVAA